MSSKLLDAVSGPAFDVAQRYLMRRSDEKAERIGERFGLLAYLVDKKHRTRTIKNLELAFPEWTDKRRLETAKGVFRHFGRMWVQFMRGPARSSERVLATTEIVGLEHLLAAEAQEKGILFVSGHFGNWECFAQWFRATGRSLSTVQRDANQSGINQRLVKLREASGMDVLSRGSAARSILAKLRKKGNIALLTDQNAGDVYVPFFGKPAGTVTGPAIMSLRTFAPIIPTYTLWLSPGHYRIQFSPPIVARPDQDPIESITAEINASLEEMVRQHPDQWLWMHDRWKSARQQGML